MDVQALGLLAGWFLGTVELALALGCQKNVILWRGNWDSGWGRGVICPYFHSGKAEVRTWVSRPQTLSPFPFPLPEPSPSALLPFLLGRQKRIWQLTDGACAGKRFSHFSVQFALFVLNHLSPLCHENLCVVPNKFQAGGKKVVRSEEAPEVTPGVVLTLGCTVESPGVT